MDGFEYSAANRGKWACAPYQEPSKERLVAATPLLGLKGLAQTWAPTSGYTQGPGFSFLEILHKSFRQSRNQKKKNMVPSPKSESELEPLS